MINNHHNLSSGNACVLLSGGIDSTACVAFYLKQNFSVHCMFIDYRQAAAQRELLSAKAIAKHYHVPFSQLKWSGLHRKNKGLIFGRNAFLLISALMEMPKYSGIIAIGAHSGTSYYDCTSSFFRKMQSIFDAYTKGRIQIGVPFLKWTKHDIMAFCRSYKVPIELTYSCERGLDQPCGQCLSCRDLEILNACT